MHDTRCLVLSKRNKLKSREHEIAPLYADPILLLLELGLRSRLASKQTNKQARQQENLFANAGRFLVAIVIRLKFAAFYAGKFAQFRPEYGRYL